jgi:hypothetical protein
VALPSVVKQPSESRLYEMDFSLLLGEDETIATVDSVTVSPDDDTLTLSGAAAAVGKVARQRIEDGTAGARYKVTIVVTTSADNVLEGEGIMHVRDL